MSDTNVRLDPGQLAQESRPHAPGHVVGRWLTCLRGCREVISEACQECRRLHNERYHPEGSKP